MKKPLTHFVRKLHPNRLSETAELLLRDEAIGGKLIVVAAILALLATNSGLASFYSSLWEMKLTIGLGDFSLSKDLSHWISEGLMTIFFLVIGLELNRELRRGELRNPKTARLPVIAAVGGMLVPALIYIAINPPGSVTFPGWAIATATDIAFAIGILALVGNKIPSSVRLFLLTLAIVDDIGAIIIIGIFYNNDISSLMLGLVAPLVIAFLVLRKRHQLSLPIFVIGGILIWLLINASGVHASISGALLGLLAPLTAARINTRSVAERVERSMIPLSTFFIVPLFAFANTGIALRADIFESASTLSLSAGILCGLILGKVIGIVGTSWLMIKFNYGVLPNGANWKHITGIGFLAGIGFTVSLFVTDLAFTDVDFVNAAKISIFVASIVSGVIGFWMLKSGNKRSIE